jgi:hypothetical protein
VKYDHNKNEIVSPTAEIPITISTTAIGLYNRYGNIDTSTDAFGKLRVSNPYTLFDSNFRYDNAPTKWNSGNSLSSSITHLANASTVALTVGTASGSTAIRETNKVMHYQPGKSLLIMNSFCMSPMQDNLRQRIGYFSIKNGIFLELNNSILYIVKRSYVTGSAVDTRIPQSDWNINRLDGTDRNLGSFTLNIAKTQIFWSDIEWLGVGSVRCGFVINGQYIPCHIFHHANSESDVYMTTASLPLRCEIEAIGTLTSTATFKQICSTVISEGGYELAGTPKTIGLQVSNPKILVSKDTLYPAVSIRLKASNLDSIVLPKQLSLVGTTASDYRYIFISNADIIGANWQSVSNNSVVEYNANANSTMSTANAINLIQGYFVSTGSTSPTIQLDSQLFKYQLSSNSFSNSSITLTVAVEAIANNDKVLAALDWEELS